MKPRDDGSGELYESNHTGVVEVSGGQFELDTEYTINWRSDPRRPSFRWPKMHSEDDSNTDSRHVQWAVSGVDLDAMPGGPPVGATIVWSTDHPGYPKITWVSWGCRRADSNRCRGRDLGHCLNCSTV